MTINSAIIKKTFVVTIFYSIFTPQLSLMDWSKVTCKKCGSINDYTVTVKSGQNVCRCNACSKFLGCKPHEEYDGVSDLSEVKLPFGKYKGELVSAVGDDYLWWVYENIKMSGIVKAAIHKKLNIEE